MGQRLQPWRNGDGEKLWLSMLVDTMEEVSRPEVRMLRCDPFALAGLRAQLALPASAPSCAVSAHRASGHPVLGRPLPN
jgi:hypothetical protein